MNAHIPKNTFHSGYKFACDRPAEVIPFSYADGEHWFCAHTSIRGEYQAQSDLRDLGYEVYLPLERRWVKHPKRKERRSYPLFSSYLFVKIDANRDGFYTVKKADGIQCLLGNSSIPQAIPSELIEKIKELEGIGQFDETSIVPNLLAGSKVRIVEGPFSEFVGKLKSASTRKRVEVLLELFGRLTVNAMPLSWVRPA